MTYDKFLFTPEFDRLVDGSTSSFQRYTWKVFGGGISLLLHKALVRNDDYLRKRRVKMEEAISRIEIELGLVDPDTHPTDLTPLVLAASSLIAPLVSPPQYMHGAGQSFPEFESLGKSMQEFVLEHRATTIGRFVTRVYAEQRERPAVAASSPS